MNTVVNNNFDINKSFKPAWWLKNCHLQTAWGNIFRRNYKLPLHREEIELPNGDFIELVWLNRDSSSLVVVVPGFQGSVDSHYAKGFMNACHQQNWRVVFVHGMGVGKRPNRLVQGLHFADSEDLRMVLDVLVARERPAKIAGVGISMGGSKLLKLLCEKETNPIVAGVTISTPFEIAKSLDYLSQGFRWVYHKWLLKKICNYVERKYNELVPPINLSNLKKIRNMREFDEKVTVPLHGFESVDDYYRRGSIRAILKNITIPTLMIHAKDDPFIPENSLPKAAELSDNVLFDLQKKGGHIGFIGNRGWFRPYYWAEQRAVSFLKQYLD